MRDSQADADIAVVLGKTFLIPIKSNEWVEFTCHENYCQLQCYRRVGSVWVLKCLHILFVSKRHSRVTEM